MLSSLFIENILLIDKLNIDFSSGISVITGETGVGKSIIVDCLSLVLGKKVSSSSLLLREQGKEGIIIADFRISDEKIVEKLSQILNQKKLDLVDNCLSIKRVVSGDISKFYISNSFVPASVLQAVGAILIEVRNQSYSPRRKKKESWLDMLDRYIGFKSELNDMSHLYNEWKNIAKKSLELESKLIEINEKKEDLERMINELEEVDIKEGEEDDIIEKRNKIKMSAKIIDLLGDAKASCEDTDITSSLQRVYSVLSRLKGDNESIDIESKLSAISESCETGLSSVREMFDLIDELLLQCKDSSDQFEQFEQRLHIIRSVARKYNTLSSALPLKLLEAKSFIDNSNNFVDELADLKEKIKVVKDRYFKIAKNISDARVKHAKILSEEISEHARDLCLPNAKILIDVQFNPDSASINGLDSVSCLVSLNEGFKMSPIESVSGGEMSRLSLAISLAFLKKGGINSIVFDEIDSGVGGVAVVAMAKKIKQLSKYVQIIAITHNHNIAACGDANFLIEKNNVNGIAAASIKRLNREEKVNAIAGMIGGGFTQDSDIKSFASKIIEDFAGN